MSSTGNSSAKTALDHIRKNLSKRTFNVKFDLDETGYKPLENIGIGAYGVVCSAIHKKSQDKVAIKKIPCVFEAITVAKRTYREVKILKHFKHDNIISIREILKPKEEPDNFRDIYVVFDLMESDLHKIIYTNQELTEEHIRYFLYQILRGLKYIHSASVIHRDLKPSNLLVNEDCHVRIGDFGMARGIFSTPDTPSYYMTQYVATRWYRAPEILLSLVEYGTAVDMWSVGCIFAEMLGRKHLFPGKDYISQIKLIVGVMGSPSESLLKHCQNDIVRRIIRGLGRKQPIPWKTLFPKASKKALDVLSKMLVVNPAERISVEKALEHHYLSKYHDPDDEPICVPAFKFDFEKEYMDEKKLREVIYKEIMDFHQPRTPTLSFNAVLRPAPKSQSSDTDSNTNQKPFGGERDESKEQEDILNALHDHGEIISTDQKNIAGEITEKTTNNSLDDDVFKTTEDKQGSPVIIDTNVLLAPQLSDIEMLSAKSNDGKQDMDTQTPLVTKEPDKENTPTGKKTQESKTISMGTKALIKQALLNASQRRQRTESGGDEGDSKSRPVTAAQRQREREEKRRKKKERATDRMKRMKEKNNTAKANLLTDADRELLKRWTYMHKIAPAPVKSEVKSVLTQPGIAMGNVGTGLIIAQGQTVVQHSTPSVPLAPVQLQTQIQTRATVLQANSGAVQNNRDILQSLPRQTVSPPKPVHTLSHSDTQTGSTHAPNTSGLVLAGSDHQQIGNTFGHLGMEELSSLVSKPEPEHMSCMFQSGQQNLASHIDTSVMQTPNQSIQNVVTSQPLQYIQQRQTADSRVQQQHGVQEGAFSTQSNTGQNIGHSNQAANSGFTTVNIDGLQFLSLLPPANETSTQNNQGVNVLETSSGHQGFNFNPPPPYSQNLTHASAPTLATHSPNQPSQERVSDQDAFIFTQPFPPPAASLQHQEHGVHFVPPHTVGQVSQEDPSNFSTQESFTSSHVQTPFANYDTPSVASPPTFSETSTQPGYVIDETNSPLSNNFSADSPHSNTASPKHKPPHGQGQVTQQPPTLKITCSSPPRPPQTHDHHDFIALLSKQFSKQQVEDIFPPSLSLTPKGTGDGYGVGTDLDSLMVDMQEHDSVRVEQSPLSSSLLADWLDITENINLADLEQFGLQLPMSLSYSDLHLNPS